MREKKVFKKTTKLRKNIYKALIVLLFVLGGLFLLFKNRLFSKGITSKVGREMKEREEEEVFEWVKWQDPAGFEFEYPRGVDIDSHEEDEMNYAHLDLMKERRGGKITILCNDTGYLSVDDWLKNDKLVKEGSSLEATIASMSGRRVALGSGREVAAFIDSDKVIYIVDQLSEGENYWRPIYSRILDSFKLIPLEGESEETFYDWFEGFDTSQADVVEPMEIIE